MHAGISRKDIVDVGEQKCSSSMIHISTKEAVSSIPKCAGLLSEGSVDRQALVAASNVHKNGMLGL